MAVHDEYLRRTPLELTFPDTDAVEDFTSTVASAGEEAGVDLADRQAFVTLGAVGLFLRRLQAGEPRPEGAYDYAMLLYHVFHFVRSGTRPLLVSEATARALVAGDGAGDTGDSRGAALELPSPAGYAQLPRSLFWTQSAPDEAPEAVDGFFWSLGEEGRLHVLLVVGIRPDRAGFAVVPVPEAPWADAPDWLDASIRPDGDDFATTLPGGELEGLYSFTAAGEVLKLAARLFVHMHAHPDAVRESGVVEGRPFAAEDTTAAPAAPAAPDEPDTTRPPRSALPYRRI